MEFRSFLFPSLYTFFKNKNTNVNYGGLVTNTISEESMSRWLHNAPSEVLSFVSEFITECDTGVKSIKIFENKNPTEETETYFPIFYHGVNSTQPVTTHT